MAEKEEVLEHVPIKLHAYAIKKPAFTFTIDDLVRIRQNPNYRLTASPFAGEDVVFAGRSVPWKGVKGIETVREINKDVAAGLEKAISISQACRDKKGVTLFRGRWLPYKVICQIEKKGKAVAVTPKPA